MTLAERAAALIASGVHAVITEYRKLDTPPPAPYDPAKTEISCTGASTQARWQPTPNVPASPFGFNMPPEKDDQ